MTAKLKIRQYFRIAFIRVYTYDDTVPDRQIYKSANIFISAALDQTAKFKDHQYFGLYGMLCAHVKFSPSSAGLYFACKLHQSGVILLRLLP